MKSRNDIGVVMSWSDKNLTLQYDRVGEKALHAVNGEFRYHIQIFDVIDHHILHDWLYPFRLGFGVSSRMHDQIRRPLHRVTP